MIIYTPSDLLDGGVLHQILCKVQISAENRDENIMVKKI